MSKRKSRTQLRLQTAEILQMPLGFYLLEDHGHILTCIRYFNEAERMEIVANSLAAQHSCSKSHVNKPGKCCVLLRATEADWRLYHP